MDAPTPRDADDDERATPQAKSSPPETQRPIVVPLGAHQMLRDEFTCPITRQLMRQPVIAADGHTYDRQAIETWRPAAHEPAPAGRALQRACWEGVCAAPGRPNYEFRLP